MNTQSPNTQLLDLLQRVSNTPHFDEAHMLSDVEYYNAIDPGRRIVADSGYRIDTIELEQTTPELVTVILNYDLYRTGESLRQTTLIAILMSAVTGEVCDNTPMIDVETIDDRRCRYRIKHPESIVALTFDDVWDLITILDDVPTDYLFAIPTDVASRALLEHIKTEGFEHE